MLLALLLLLPPLLTIPPSCFPIIQSTLLVLWSSDPLRWAQGQKHEGEEKQNGKSEMGSPTLEELEGTPNSIWSPIT